jgi:hypothetical protein
MDRHSSINPTYLHAGIPKITGMVKNENRKRYKAIVI